MLAVRYRSTQVPTLPPLEGMSVERITDARLMAHLQNKPMAEMQKRFAEGHRAYVAFVAGDAAGWGWVATRQARIGELETTFSIPQNSRYLWNFVTATAHRGRGIYPRLLDAIVTAESADAEQFWIAYAPENHASAAGIHKAGFVTVATLSFDAVGGPAVIGVDYDTGRVVSDLLGLPQSGNSLSQCWRCAQSKVQQTAGCSAGSCCCDYQQPETACAAPSKNNIEL